MNNKKDQLISILIKLEKYWSLAKTLRVFVESKYASEENVDQIITHISEVFGKWLAWYRESMQTKKKITAQKANVQQEKDIMEAEMMLMSLWWEVLEQNIFEEKPDNRLEKKDINLTNISNITKELWNSIDKRKSFAELLDSDKGMIILLHDLLKSAYVSIISNKNFDQLDESDKNLIMAYLNFFGDEWIFTQKDEDFQIKPNWYTTRFTLEGELYDRLAKDYIFSRVLISLNQESMWFTNNELSNSERVLQIYNITPKQLNRWAINKKTSNDFIANKDLCFRNDVLSTYWLKDRQMIQWAALRMILEVKQYFPWWKDPTQIVWDVSKLSRSEMINEMKRISLFAKYYNEIKKKEDDLFLWILKSPVQSSLSYKENELRARAFRDAVVLYLCNSWKLSSAKSINTLFFNRTPDKPLCAFLFNVEETSFNPPAAGVGTKEIKEMIVWTYIDYIIQDENELSTDFLSWMEALPSDWKKTETRKKIHDGYLKQKVDQLWLLWLSWSRLDQQEVLSKQIIILKNKIESFKQSEAKDIAEISKKPAQWIWSKYGNVDTHASEKSYRREKTQEAIKNSTVEVMKIYVQIILDIKKSTWTFPIIKSDDGKSNIDINNYISRKLLVPCPLFQEYGIRMDFSRGTADEIVRESFGEMVSDSFNAMINDFSAWRISKWLSQALGLVWWTIASWLAFVTWWPVASALAFTGWQKLWSGLWWVIWAWFDNNVTRDQWLKWWLWIGSFKDDGTYEAMKWTSFGQNFANYAFSLIRDVTTTAVTFRLTKVLPIWQFVERCFGWLLLQWEKSALKSIVNTGITVVWKWTEYGLSELIFEEMLISKWMNVALNAPAVFLWLDPTVGNKKIWTQSGIAENYKALDLWDMFDVISATIDQEFSKESMAQTIGATLSSGMLLKWYGWAVAMLSAYSPHVSWSLKWFPELEKRMNVFFAWVTVNEHGIVKKNGVDVEMESFTNDIKSIQDEMRQCVKQWKEALSKHQEKIANNTWYRHLVQRWEALWMNNLLKYISVEKAIELYIRKCKEKLNHASGKEKEIYGEIIHELEQMSEELKNESTKSESKDEDNQNNPSNPEIINNDLEIIDLAPEQTQQTINDLQAQVDDQSSNITTPDFIQRVNSLLLNALLYVGINPGVLDSVLQLLQKIQIRNSNWIITYLTSDLFSKLLSILNGWGVLSPVALNFMFALSMEHMKSNKWMTLDHKAKSCVLPQKIVDGKSIDIYVDAEGKPLSSEKALEIVKKHDNFIAILFEKIWAISWYAVKTTFHLTDELTLPRDKDVAMNVDTSKKLIDELLGDNTLWWKADNLKCIDKSAGLEIDVNLANKERLYALAQAGELKIVFDVTVDGVTLEHEYFAENGGWWFDVFDGDGNHKGNPKLVWNTTYIWYDAARQYTLAVLKYEMKLLGEWSDQKWKLYKRIKNLMELIQNGDKDSEKKLWKVWSTLRFLFPRFYDEVNNSNNKSESFEKAKLILKSEIWIDDDIIDTLVLPWTSSNKTIINERDFTLRAKELQQRIFAVNTVSDRDGLLVELDQIINDYDFSSRNGWAYLVQLQLFKKILLSMRGWENSIDKWSLWLKIDKDAIHILWLNEVEVKNNRKELGINQVQYNLWSELLWPVLFEILWFQLSSDPGLIQRVWMSWDDFIQFASKALANSKGDIKIQEKIIVSLVMIMKNDSFNVVHKESILKSIHILHLHISQYDKWFDRMNNLLYSTIIDCLSQKDPDRIANSFLLLQQLSLLHISDWDSLLRTWLFSQLFLPLYIQWWISIERILLFDKELSNLLPKNSQNGRNFVLSVYTDIHNQLLPKIISGELSLENLSVILKQRLSANTNDGITEQVNLLHDKLFGYVDEYVMKTDPNYFKWDKKNKNQFEQEQVEENSAMMDVFLDEWNRKNSELRNKAKAEMLKTLKEKLGDILPAWFEVSEEFLDAVIDAHIFNPKWEVLWEFSPEVINQKFNIIKKYISDFNKSHENKIPIETIRCLMEGGFAGSGVGALIYYFIRWRPTFDDPNKDLSFEERKKIAQEQLEKKGITDEQAIAYMPGLSERLYERITPHWYEVWLKIYEFLYGKDDPVLDANWKKADNDDKIMDAWAIYLWLPQKNDTFKVSDYVPSRSNSDMLYLALQDEQRIFEQFREMADAMSEFDDKINSWYTISQMMESEKKSLKDAMRYWDQRSVLIHLREYKYLEQYQLFKDQGKITLTDVDIGRYDDDWNIIEQFDGLMWQYTMYSRVDDNGLHYISYYDIRDLHPFPWPLKGLWDRLPGKPFEIYGRIYYDPETMQVIDPATGKPKEKINDQNKDQDNQLLNEDPKELLIDQEATEIISSIESKESDPKNYDLIKSNMEKVDVDPQQIQTILSELWIHYTLPIDPLVLVNDPVYHLIQTVHSNYNAFETDAEGNPIYRDPPDNTVIKLSHTSLRNKLALLRDGGEVNDVHIGPLESTLLAAWVTISPEQLKNLRKRLLETGVCGSSGGFLESLPNVRSVLTSIKNLPWGPNIPDIQGLIDFLEKSKPSQAYIMDAPMDQWEPADQIRYGMDKLFKQSLRANGFDVPMYASDLHYLIIYSLKLTKDPSRIKTDINWLMQIAQQGISQIPWIKTIIEIVKQRKEAEMQKKYESLVNENAKLDDDARREAWLKICVIMLPEWFNAQRKDRKGVLRKAIIDAHRVWRWQIGADGKTVASVFNYTVWQLVDKMGILTKAGEEIGITRAQSVSMAKELLWNGICGDPKVEGKADGEGRVNEELTEQQSKTMYGDIFNKYGNELWSMDKSERENLIRDGRMPNGDNLPELKASVEVTSDMVNAVEAAHLRSGPIGYQFSPGELWDANKSSKMTTTILMRKQAIIMGYCKIGPDGKLETGSDGRPILKDGYSAGSTNVGTTDNPNSIPVPPRLDDIWPNGLPIGDAKKWVKSGVCGIWSAIDALWMLFPRFGVYLWNTSFYKQYSWSEAKNRIVDLEWYDFYNKIFSRILDSKSISYVDKSPWAPIWVYMPRTEWTEYNSSPKVNIAKSWYDSKWYAIHENTHKLEKWWYPEFLPEKSIKLLLSSFYDEAYVHNNNIDGYDRVNRRFLWFNVVYLLNPTEIHARINMIRHNLNPDNPRNIVSYKDWDLILNQSKNNPSLFATLKLVKDRDKFIDMINTMR